MADSVAHPEEAAHPRTPHGDQVMRRYKVTLAYDGSAFHGWQKQHRPGKEPLRTVQQVVEDTLQRLLRQPVRMVGASRTDAGVHAKGQVAEFDAATPIPIERLARALRGRLPDDVDVVDVAYASDTFRAINDVTSKQYKYRMWTDELKPLGQRHMLYHARDRLDHVPMHTAAQRLVGTHDFLGLTTVNHGRLTTTRTIFHCEVERETAEPRILTITVEGSGFLYNMVRIIAGTLYEVGRGQFGPERIDRILETKDRRLAGPTLGPEGLCLEWIRYE